MRCLTTAIHQLKNRYSLNENNDMPAAPHWEIWQSPLSGGDIVILSAALQPTSAVGTNMVDMKHDPGAIVSDDMVEIRLLDSSKNKVHTVTFHDVSSFSFRYDSLAAAVMDPQEGSCASESQVKANHLLRGMAPEYDITGVGLTRWRIQDAEAILEILSDQALPHFTTINWE